MTKMRATLKLLPTVWENRAFLLAHARRATAQNRMRLQLQRDVDPDALNAIPTQVCLRVTYVCNLRCKMCGQWGETGTYFNYERDKLVKQLSLEDLTRVLDELQPISRPLIDMEGGETFMHDDIVGVLSLLKSRGLFVKPVTNGTFLAQYAADVVRLGVDQLSVSIDGDEETHDSVRRARGTFRKAIEGLFALAQEKRRQGRRLPFVQIATTVTRHNYESLERMCDQFEKERVPLDRVMLKQPIFIPPKKIETYEQLMKKEFGVEASSARGFEEDYSDFDVEPLRQSLARIARKGYPFRIDLLPRMPLADLARFYDHDALVTPNRCTIPWDTPTIDADGNVYPCNLFPDISMGNVTRQPFLEIWHGERYRRFRRLLADGLLSICNRCCQLTGA